MNPLLSIRETFLACILITLVGCSGNLKPDTPAQSVFAAKATYAGALIIAVQYKNLPACPKVPICSDPLIVGKLQAADNIAAPALNSAEAAVRNPDFGRSALQTAVIAAQNAVSALTSITSTIRVK